MTLILIDAAAWLGLSVVIGFAGARLPTHRLADDGLLTRLRPFEGNGRLWEATGVRRWKDRLPEAGALFGGVSKRHLPAEASGGASVAGRAAGLERLTIETRRAELVHWALVAVTPFFALWNPPAMTLAMAAYATAANAPCIIVQRYNRGRAQQVLAVRNRRRTALVNGDR